MDSLTITFTGKSQLEHRSLPVDEPGPGEVLVATQSSLISTGTELICYLRNFEEGTHWDMWVRYPFFPGYSNAGIVVARGQGADRFEEGQLVAYRAGHRQYAVVPESTLLAVPPGVTAREASWIALAKIVQNGVRRAEHVMGDDVAVVGQGILGQLVVQYARLMGARNIIAIDLAAQRLEYSAEISGATHTLQMPVDEALPKVAGLTSNAMPDVVYDVTGFPAVFASALKLPRKFGTLVLLGDTGTPSGQQLSSDVIIKGLKIVGAHDSHPPNEPTDWNHWTSQRISELFFTYLARGQMNVKDLITHTYKPRQAQEAYEMLARDRTSALGVVFDWT
ncbi:MAG: zinc-binding dehydrogenase [Caldilineaceae bacterium]|nr:zinc-binding dehydrogenase [Caldilineaceae bacterium]